MVPILCCIYVVDFWYNKNGCLFETEDQIFFPFGTASFDPEIVPSQATLLLAAIKRVESKAVELCYVDSREDFDDLLEKLETDWNVDDRPMYDYFVMVTARK